MLPVLYDNAAYLHLGSMCKVVLSYAGFRWPDLRPLVRLWGGCVVPESEETLAVRFATEALANVFCRVLDKFHLPTLVAVVD
jgi:hypothetical protein